MSVYFKSIFFLSRIWSFLRLKFFCFVCFIFIYNSNTTVILTFDCRVEMLGEPLIISAFRPHCRPIKSASFSTDINFLKTPGRMEKHQYLPGIGVICYFKELLNHFNLHTIPMKTAKLHSYSSFSIINQN